MFPDASDYNYIAATGECYVFETDACKNGTNAANEGNCKEIFVKADKCPTAKECKEAHASATPLIMQSMDDMDAGMNGETCGDMPTRPTAADEFGDNCMNWDAWLYLSDDDTCNNLWEEWDKWCYCSWDDICDDVEAEMPWDEEFVLARRARTMKGIKPAELKKLAGARREVAMKTQISENLALLGAAQAAETPEEG